MTTTSNNRVPSGVPAGGQFAATARAEGGVSLSDDERSRLRRATSEQMERLIARATMDGEMTATDRPEDVAFDIRQDFPHLSDEEFDRHFQHMAQLAELASAVEGSDPADTEAYADAAEVAELDLTEFPVEEYDGDGVYYDVTEFHAGVISELEYRIYMRTAELVDEDAAARAGYEGSESARESVA